VQQHRHARVTRAAQHAGRNSLRTVENLEQSADEYQ
jgi:hypothetical protein